MRPPKVRWPGAAKEGVSAYEKFRELAGRLIRVPKAEAEEQAKRYREERAQRKK